jgi:glycogen debranching enzyme
MQGRRQGAWGLARAGRHADAQRILRRMVEAATHFEYRLPEVFAGFARGRTPMPVAYPTASVPQAWAAGTPVLLLRVLLGLEPDRAAGMLRVRPDELPSWLGSLSLDGIRAYGKRWTLRVEDRRASVSSDMLEL